jgi:hypothetical protein
MNTSQSGQMNTIIDQAAAFAEIVKQYQAVIRGVLFNLFLRKMLRKL